MATQNKFSISSVTTGVAFSDSVTIIAEDKAITPPPSNWENLTFIDYSVNKDISGVSVTVNKVGNNLVVSVSGNHGIDPFNNVIRHFTRGRSTKWESPQTDDSFADIDPEERQVYSWTPDFSNVTVTYTINYTNDGVPESKSFTQLITPNYNPEIPTFLNSI